MISVIINSLTSGGAEKVVLTLLNRFKYSGVRPELILIENERFYELPTDVSTTYLTKYESLEKGPLKWPYVFICAWRLRKTIHSPGQIVQSHLLRASFINVIAKMMGSRHHAQIVVHSRINFEHKPYFYKIFAKWVYRQIFMRADSIVSICQVMKNELDEYLGMKAHPMHLAIYNPHNLTEIQAKAKEEMPFFEFRPEKKYIISVGRIVNGKRIDDLINAFKAIEQLVPEAELIIVGNGELQESMERLSIKCGLAHRIHFTGYCKNPFAYIARADLLVLSSEWEGLPNILIEAMACGTAVLSADCISGPREIIHPDSDLSKQLKDEIEYGTYGMLYPVGAVTLLAEAIKTVLTDDALRETFSTKGLERARDFDEAKISQAYLDTFKNS